MSEEERIERAISTGRALAEFVSTHLELDPTPDGVLALASLGALLQRGARYTAKGDGPGEIALVDQVVARVHAYSDGADRLRDERKRRN